MRHETVITQHGFLNILKKFHSLSKSKDSELVVEVTDKEVISRIEVPILIEKLAEDNNISIEDMISFILRDFEMSWKNGKSTYQNMLNSDVYNKFKKSTNLKDFVDQINKGEI